jgi:hypothetical protein
MDAATLRELARIFEVSAHTLDHIDLTTVQPSEAEQQVREGRQRLEDMIETVVHGFCYPRGKFNPVIREIVRKAGFAYARGNKNFCSALGNDRFAIPVTVQFFPHTKCVYARNLLKHGITRDRLRLCRPLMSGADLVACVKRLVDRFQGTEGIFHLWGHSWELEKYELWEDLEDVFRYLRSSVPGTNCVKNCELLSMMDYEPTAAERAAKAI